jgi:hypothetical protein
MAETKLNPDQELLLLKMSVNAIRQDVVIQLDAIAAKIDTLLPKDMPRRNSKSIMKSMKDKGLL